MTVAEFAEGTLVFPKLNQSTNHIPPVLNACFFMVDFALQVNVTEDDRILHDVCIYRENGVPCVIQHDQGPEFDGAVSHLCKNSRLKSLKDNPTIPNHRGKWKRSLIIKGKNKLMIFSQ